VDPRAATAIAPLQAESPTMNTSPSPRARSVLPGLLMLAAIALASSLAARAAAQPSATPSAGAAAPAVEGAWQVLILNGTDPTLPAFIAIDNAMRAALAAPGRHPVEIFAETLDMMRFPQKEIEPELLQLLRKKYASRHIDVVIAVTAPALDFALNYREALWPRARIVFHSVPVADVAGRALPAMVTGIPVHIDIAGAAAVALRLRPSTRRIIVIAGSAEYDQMMAAFAREQLGAKRLAIPVEYWTDRTVDALLAAVATLSGDDAVLYLTVYRDQAGRTFIPREVLRLLSAASRAPFYGVIDTYLGLGMAAGSVDTFAERGRRAAEAVFVLMALPPGTPVPLFEPAAAHCVADGSRMAALGLPESRLPAGCSIQFEPPSLWREYRWYVVAALAAVLAQSALILALVVQRRARRRAEVDARNRRAELAQASRLALAGELTALIAHEINQPLGAMLANAGAADKLLKRDVLDRAELAAIVADIRRDNVRAGEVIRRVRALVTGREVEREEVDLVELARNTVRFLAGEAERRGAAVTFTSTVEALPTPVDRVQIQQAIINLCVNALDAVADVPSARRRVEIGVRALADGAAALTVADHGEGIAPDVLPRLFDSFFTTKVHGIGLGLSITRTIVEAHGGRLTVQNDPAGGARFTMVLPRGAAMADAPMADAATSP
jgi:signal transduction histidine kinase